MELLAPAGDMECLKTAVNCGADAVYFAGKQFGARSFAGNFDHGEIAEAAEFCALRGVKSYLTVNTMVLDREYEDLHRFICTIADAGVDGVIVQDLGVLQFIRQICPDMPVHASTQMTVHNLAGVRALEKLGVSRVVLSRELSQREIAYIAENAEAELEVFVHGAMCMSYSGQCLMSSVLGGRSGNRGKCAQPCRLGYHKDRNGERFYLSLKDMSLIRHLESLKTMGVASLKIEGRMKGPDYVAAVVETYRRCIDENRKPTREEEARMNRVFFRGGLTDGYFTENKGKGMFAFDKPDNPYARQEAKEAAPPERTTAAACDVKLCQGKPAECTLSALGLTVTVYTEQPLEEANRNPATAESAKAQLGKTGGTAFVFSPLSVTVEGSPFVPVSMLNQLRRDAIAALTEQVMAKRKKACKMAKNQEPTPVVMPFSLIASVRTKAQFLALCDMPFAYLEVPLAAAAAEPEVYLPYKERVILAPPVIQKDGACDTEALQRMHRLGFVHLRAETIGVTEQTEWILHGGHRLNCGSTNALAAYGELGLNSLCFSAEMNLSQIRDCKKGLETELIVYGHLPLMLTENCILKNLDACPCDGVGYLTDRKGTAFPVIKDGDACRSVVLNSVPLYLADKLEDVKGTGVSFGRLLFTIEPPEECRRVAEQYMKLRDCKAEGAFTRLHLYKGVL